MTKEIVSTNEKSPNELIQMAVEKGSDLEKLEKIMELQSKWEANQAKKAYNQAIAKFKSNPPIITKDKKNIQYNTMYTTLGNLVNTVNPKLSEQGLSASWEIEQNGIIKVTCVLTHSMGHSERASASAPADASGSKNVIQQIKSTITYLKAVTFESITGLASSDANLDDDGIQAFGAQEVLNDSQLNEITNYLDNYGVDQVKFLKYVSSITKTEINGVEGIPASKFDMLIKMLKQKTEKATQKTKGGK